MYRVVVCQLRADGLRCILSRSTATYPRGEAEKRAYETTAALTRPYYAEAVAV